MRRRAAAVMSVLVLLSLPVSPCLAWGEISAKRILLELPETIESPFLVQIYEMVNSVDRLMVASSEFQDARPKGNTVEMSANFGQTFYLSESIDNGMADTYFVRIIKSTGRSYQYKDFRTWRFQVRESGDLLVDNCSPVEHAAWKPIQLSKEFSVYWQEENPYAGEDYSENAAIINGLPKSFLSPQPLNKETAWRFKVKGIFYSEGGGERYILEPVYRVNGKYEERGTSQITIEILNKSDFSLKESSYHGD